MNGHSFLKEAVNAVSFYAYILICTRARKHMDFLVYCEAFENDGMCCG